MDEDSPNDSVKDMTLRNQDTTGDDEETRFVRGREDYRRDKPELVDHRFPGETVDEKNSRMGIGDPDLVRTVYVRRSDGVIKELDIIYDSRFETYDGFPVLTETPSTTYGILGSKRSPLKALEYSSHANIGSKGSQLNDAHDEGDEEATTPPGHNPYDYRPWLSFPYGDDAGGFSRSLPR
jgi:hypothetical protein